MAKMGAAATSSALDDERVTRIASDVRVGFFEADAQGSLTFASDSWRAIMEMEDAAIEGWIRAVHPADRDRVAAAWTQAVASVCALEVTYRVVRARDILTVRTSMAPVADRPGQRAFFAGVVIDVTDLAHAGEALTEAVQQFRTVAEVIPQLMWIAAADGTIEYFNRPWLEYTGVTVEAMHESGVKNVVHPDELALTWEHWKNALETGEPYEIEYRLRNAKTGAYRWFLARATPYRDRSGAIARWIGTATDIDAQRRSNDNLRFVLDASSVLSANLDVDGVCATLANIAVQSVADWCFIVLKDGDETYRTHAIAHRDAQRVRLLEQVREQYPVRKGSMLDRIIRRNTPLVLPSIGERDLSAAAESAAHLEILRSLGMHSAMLLPLSTEDGTVFGGITLVSSESARAYTVDDLEVAHMVARRAAAAIHTASAFAQERRRAEDSRFIAQVSELLVDSAGLSTMLDRVAQFVVTRMADLCYVILAEDRDALRTVACAHADPEKAPIAERLRGQRTLRPEAEEHAIRMLSQHRTLLHKTVPVDAVLASMWEYLAPDVRALDIHCAVTVPLFSRGETYGALVMYRCSAERAYADEDAELFTDLGRRLSSAIEHHRTLERERRIAEVLQQALLPQAGMLPQAPGMHFQAHYRPSSRESEVGGDWYDAVTLPNGSIMVSVGDVTGRGLHAAGLMGKLRQALGMAAMYEGDPARMLDAVDFQLRSRRSQSLATAFVGIIDPQRKTLRYAGAGHPPAILRRKGKLIELRSTGLPLGLRNEDVQVSDTISVEGADLLVLYTDGLIESTRDLAFGEQRLGLLASSEAISFVRNPAKFLCDACLPPDAQDDTAVLTVSFGDSRSWEFDAENAQAAHQVRDQLVKYLRERGGPHADTAGAELVFGELVGNVVRHAPGPIEVQIEWTPEYPVLHVIDRGRGFITDPDLPSDLLSEGGRGLYIVSKLAHELRVERIPGYGNHVAAALRL